MMFSFKVPLLAAGTLLLNPVASVPATGVFIPSVNTYLLPEPFKGPEASNLGYLSTGYINTQVTSDGNNITALFAAARNSTYYALDAEFYDIIGSAGTPDIQEVASSNLTSFFEAGVWVPERNEVWFTSLGHPGYVSILNLTSNEVTRPSIPALNNINPNGGNYFNGLVYFTAAGNQSVPDGATKIVSVNPDTYETKTILNSFFGEVMTSIDDLTWVKPNNTSDTAPCSVPGESNMFFTTLDFKSEGLPGFAPTVLPNAVWRFSPQTRSLQGVIPRADILKPNGVISDASGSHLFVTDASVPFNVGGGSNSSGSGAIYRYDLDPYCNPVNKLLFAIVRSYADGLHVDDYGRVWSGEYDGIVVRNSRGKVIGVFNAETLDDSEAPMANFALAGNKLIILGVTRMYVLQLAQTVVNPTRYTIS
jgi:gluconolactonase